MNEGLKLYIWKDVLTDFTSGAMWCLASSVKEARELLRNRAKREGDYSDSFEKDLRQQPIVKITASAYYVFGGA